MNNKVILVEDDEELSAALETSLKAEGYSVKRAITGEEGLKIIQEDIPDVAILDLFTHSIHGVHLLERLKSSPATKDIECIILTNIDHEGHRKKAMSLGAVAYLIKSKTPLSEIVKVVQSCFETKNV